MISPSNRAGRSCKTRGLAVVGCALVFIMVGAATVYWNRSHPREDTRRAVQRQLVNNPAGMALPATEAARRETQQTGIGLSQARPREANPVAEALPAGQDNTPPPAPMGPGPVGNAIAKLGGAAARSLKGEDLFTDAFIPKLRIEIPAQGMTGLRRRPRQYVRATIHEGDTVYTNVAIHLKGGPGSYRNLDDTPSFTVNFDKFAEKQTFHGLKKIHLNSSVQDRSYLSEKICRELFDAADVPTPQAGHAVVTFNGRMMGLYVLVEGVNKQFLKRYFTDVTGNVYDGHSGTDVTDNLPTNAGENRQDHTGLRALAVATRTSGLDKRWSALQTTLDVDRFLSFVAMETMLWHWDGYTIGRNNFRIFHDRGMQRMVFLPQGLDQVLSNPQGPVLPNAQGLVARTVLETPQGRELYRGRMAQLSTNLFRIEAITNRIYEVSQKIQAALAEIDPAEAVAHRQRARSFCRRFQQRANHLRRQLHPVPSVNVDHLTAIPVTDWLPQTDLGEATLAKEQSEDGNLRLRITTSTGCTASWRTTAVLDSGEYRLEGRLRTQGVVFPENDPRAGAGLRISRHRVGQRNAGNRDWTPVSFDFEVREDQSEVELVCELRALQGDVWFDSKSLKLKRR